MQGGEGAVLGSWARWNIKEVHENDLNFWQFGTYSREDGFHTWTITEQVLNISHELKFFLNHRNSNSWSDTVGVLWDCPAARRRERQALPNASILVNITDAWLSAKRWWEKHGNTCFNYQTLDFNGIWMGWTNHPQQLFFLNRILNGMN